jgi:predicted CXXCH cytochrome family protein
MSRIGIAAGLLLLAAPRLASAAQAPHDVTQGFDCSSCHMVHRSLGTGLTKNSANSVLCDSCHSASTNFGFPWGSSMQAQAGVAGSSHSWSALASNLGATPPDPASVSTLARDMAAHLDTGGKLKCTTCHDTHAQKGGGTLHTSVALGAPLTHTGTGTGGLSLTNVQAGAKAAGYVIKVSAATQFKISHDNGATYLGFNGTSWDLDTKAGFTNGKTFSNGSSVTLDDALASVTFTVGNAIGDVYQRFYVSYPFLRGDAATMCVTCHQNRNQTWQNVEGSGPIVGNNQAVVLGTTYFSHPVNQPMNANGHGYDRAIVLDADGSTTTDGNKSNDLVLNASGNVTCMTCHYVHNADSNSLTVDPR